MRNDLEGIFLNIDGNDDLSIPLDEEDLAAIAVLTESDVTAIDEAILLQLSAHWQKTALVVSRAMDAYPDKYFDVPDIYYGQRVLVLAAKGLMDSQGNLQRMRFSEVRARDFDVMSGSL